MNPAGDAPIATTESKNRDGIRDIVRYPLFAKSLLTDSTRPKRRTSPSGFSREVAMSTVLQGLPQTVPTTNHPATSQLWFCLLLGLVTRTGIESVTSILVGDAPCPLSYRGRRDSITTFPACPYLGSLEPSTPVWLTVLHDTTYNASTGTLPHGRFPLPCSHLRMWSNGRLTRPWNRLKTVSDLDGLEEWRVSVLGRNGALTQILRGLGSAPKEERPRLGAAANSAKTVLEQHLAEREQELRSAHLADVVDRESIDVTLPGWPVPQGRLHPDDADDARGLRVPLPRSASRSKRGLRSSSTTTTSTC